MNMPKMTLRPVWLALPALLALWYAWTQVQYPLDFWHHLTTGRLIWQTGSVPTADTFTCTIAGRPIVNQNWLAQLAMYRLFERGGFELVQLVAGLCYGLTLAVTTLHAWYRCRSVLVAAGLTIAAFALAISNLGVRPQAVSVLLFAVELLVLWQWPGGWRSAGAVAAVELLWANTHGSFPLGVALPGIFLAGAGWQRWHESGWAKLPSDRAIRWYAACMLAALAAAFCNPHPQKTAGYFLVVASKAAQRGIGEWRPPELGTYTAAALVLSIAAALLVLLLDRQRLKPLELLLLVLLALLGARSQRMVIWWGLVAVPALAPHLAVLLPSAGKEPARGDQRSSLSFVMVLLLAALTAVSTPWTRAYNPLLPPAKRQSHPDVEPRGVVQFLQESGCRGRVFSPMEWGAYLTWFLDPQVKVFIDGRVDFFPDEVWNDYVDVGNARPGWEEILARYGINLVVWNRQLSPQLPAALQQSGCWKNVYEDPLGTVFVRLQDHSPRQPALHGNSPGESTGGQHWGPGGRPAAGPSGPMPGKSLFRYGKVDKVVATSPERLKPVVVSCYLTMPKAHRCLQGRIII